MTDVNENKSDKVKLLKHFIKDLSFENPQDINRNNSTINNNNNITANMNVVYEPFRDHFFSVLIKIYYDCSSKEDNNKLCHLELDYFGFFKALKENVNQKSLTEIGLELIFPYAKTIVEDISRKGGSIPISLNDVEFKLTETKY